MKVFGRAWLQFDVEKRECGAEIRQTAVYDPRGLSGLVYWYAVYPLHELVFSGMLTGIAKAAAGSDSPKSPRRVAKAPPNHPSLPPQS